MGEMTKTTYRPGAYVYIEGDEDIDEVYIVEKGLVEFTSSTDRVRPRGTRAGPGDVFGFISSLSKRPRMESAVVKAPTTLLVLSRDHFLSLLQKRADIALKLLDSFAEELRVYDNMILPLHGPRDVFLPEDEQLFNLGAYYYRQKQYAAAFYVMNRYLSLAPSGTHEQEARSFTAELEKLGAARETQPIPEGIYRRYVDRQIIFCEHEPGDECFIITKGKVKIVKYDGRNEIILSVLKEGDIFGELALVSDKPRNATAFSFGGTVVLPVNKEALIKLINKSSDLLKRIFTSISQRVWFTYIRTEAKLYQKPITRVYALLENKLIEEGISLKSREPHTFNFGINELLKMTEIPASHVSEVTAELMNDRNLSFQESQILIDSPSMVSSRARYFRSRDHLYELTDEDQDRTERSARSIDTARNDTGIKPQKGAAVRANAGEPIVDAAPSAPTDDLFAEMDEEIHKPD